MNCEEVEALAAAFALYALPPDEMEGVQAHLATCSKHLEVAELVAVASAISLEAPEMEPPPALKARLMTAVRADAPQAPVPDPRSGFLDALTSWFKGRSSGWALAGGLAVLVVALAVWNAGLQSGGNDVVVTNLSSSQGVTAKVVYIKDEAVAVMSVQGLAPLAPGKTYEVWSITGGTPTGIGFLAVTSSGQNVTAMHADLSHTDTVAVTIEPAGGSPLPTTDPVLAGDL